MVHGTWENGIVRLTMVLRLTMSSLWLAEVGKRYPYATSDLVLGLSLGLDR